MSLETLPVKNIDIRGIINTIFQRNIQTMKPALAMTDIGNISGSRKVSGFKLVNRKGKYFRGITERIFHSVSVMNVKIDVQDFVMNSAQMLDSKDNIVNVTKS